MTPPDRLGADQTSDVATDTRPRDQPTNAPARELNSTQAALIAAQQTAGNQAVASMVGGSRGVQRAPNEPDMVVGKGDVTAVADDEKPIPNQGGVTADAGDKVPRRGAITADADDKAPVAPPKAAPAWDPKMAGGVPKVEERKWHRAQPTTEQDAQIAYQLDPSKVIRSRDRHWHWQMWNASKGAEKYGNKAPMVIRAGSLIIVHPNYQGPATPLPDYRGANVGLGPALGPGGESPKAPGQGPSRQDSGPPTGSGERPLARMPQDPTDARQRQAVAPDIAPKGAWGSQVAYKVTYQEVAEAYARNPGSVVRSPNDRWHGQAYRTDGGKGGTPGVYKVGDQYVISPGYPLDNVPYLTMPGQIGPGANAGPKGDPGKASQTVAPAGTTYSEGSASKAFSTTTTQSGDRTETRTTRRETGIVTNTTEISQGGITNTSQTQKGAGLGAGGYVAGAVYGTTDTSKIDGDVVAAKRQKQVAGGLGKDMKLGAEIKSSKEIVTGTDPDGNPVKAAQQVKVGGKMDLDGNINLTGGRDTTNQKGTTRGGGAGAKIDNKGNVELEAYYNIQSKGGLSFKPTVSRGVKVEASDPIQVEGGWEVTYRIADTTGVGVGGGKQFSGGTNVGVNVGATEAEFQGGRRFFKTEDEAKKFRDNAAARVASEQLTTPTQPPTSVAGALQIPVGETRTSGDISGKSIGGAVGHSGVAVNIGKQTSATNEMAVKRTGATTVEVTGSVAGSKTGTVGITAPALGHSYSSTNTTSFAVTFEFDLSKEQGRAAFELYVKTGFPPMQQPKVIENAGSKSDNETFTIAGLGTVVWTGTTWKVSRETADGSLTQVYGGAQIHEQKPGKIGKWIGEDTLKSNASISRVVKDGEEIGARAQFQVGGTSGEYNRKEFGKIFTGTKSQGDVKPSGEWTLSAPVPKENIDSLHKVSSKIRRSMDEREAYSELVKEGGAAMLGGQVGGGSSKSWDLELKGDANFPGEKERTRLKEMRKSLMARIRSNPELADGIVKEANTEIAKLEKRRAAVADPKRYTDLPDGLRQQQLSVIDMHIDDMKVVRRTGQSVAMKRDVHEKTSDVAARVEQAETTKAAPKKGGSRAGAKARTPNAPPAPAVEDPAVKVDREYARLQDQVAAKESQIASKRKVVREHSIALGDAIGPKGSTAIKFGADTQVVQMQVGIAKVYINVATENDKKQAALETQIEAARNAWSAATDKPGQLAAIKTLEKLLDDRLKHMELTLYNIREAGKAVFHITTRGARSGNPGFWNSLGETEGEE